MKIYFNGCSVTHGAELEHPYQQRYSKLLCDYYKSEETNNALSGGSNDRIIRQLLTEVDITEYDLGIIQMTFPMRTEWYSKKSASWLAMNIGHNYISHETKITEKNILERFKWWDWGNKDEMNTLKNAWKDYYIHIVNQKFLDNKELVHINTIRDHFKSRNVPLLLMSINHKTPFIDKYDLVLSIDKPYPTAPGGHPDQVGHQMIFQDIIKYIKNENLL
jgi:lysophospholipase L1-like esterase